MIDGCPYSFGTDGLSTLSGATSSDSEWTGSTQATLVPASLEWPSGWSERYSPADGELEVSGITFRLRDVRATSGIASGYPVLTYLGTQAVESIAYSPLAANLNASNTTIYVQDASRLPAPSTAIWLDREAIYCDARDTGADTYSATGSGRGYYNSKAATHSIVSADNQACEVFGSFPWMVRRRVSLWLIDSDLVATRLWGGYCNRSPRGDAGGVLWELQCDHAWTVVKQQKAGIPEAVTRLQGFCTTGVFLESRTDDDLLYRSDTGLPASTYNSLPELLRALCVNAVAAHETNTSTTNTLALDASPVGQGIQVLARTTRSLASIRLVIGEHEASGQATRSSGSRFFNFTLDYSPSAFVAVDQTRSLTYRVVTTRGFPSTSGWNNAGALTDSPFATSISRVLSGKLGDNVIEFWPSTHSTSDGTITATVRVYAGNALGSRVTGRVYVDEQLSLTRVVRVTASHWIYGLRRGVIELSDFDQLFDTRDWDWTANDRAIEFVTGELAGAEWALDGSYSLGELVSSQSRLSGVMLRTYGSRLSFAPLSPALQTTSGTYSLGTSDWIQGSPPRWERWSDQLTNAVEIEAGQITVVVNDRRSQARFGDLGKKSIKLLGKPYQQSYGESPATLRNVLLNRYLGLLAYEISKLTVCVSLYYQTRIYLGDYLSITDTRTPSGAGDRGVTSAIMQVVGKTLRLGPGKGYVELELIDWQRPRRVGYSPAVRVSGISGAQLTCAADYVYCAGSSTTTDYAGSDLSGYSGTANDRGVSRFAVGDKVKLIERDNTSPATPATFEVQSVDTASGKITLTTSPAAGWSTLIAGGALIDLVYDDYANLSADQTRYAAIADNTTEVIDGTADYAKRWS